MSPARQILETLIEEAFSAKANFQTWWALRNLALPDYYETMNDSTYRDYFQLANGAHYKLFFLALSKLFDNDKRATSISRLKQALRVEGYTHSADELEQALCANMPSVERIIGIRNKAIVHNQAGISRQQVYEINGITPDEIRRLIELTCNILNDTARALGMTSIIFEGNRHETSVLEMLRTLERGRPS
jgi:hypothetical protein